MPRPKYLNTLENTSEIDIGHPGPPVHIFKCVPNPHVPAKSF